MAKQEWKIKEAVPFQIDDGTMVKLNRHEFMIIGTKKCKRIAIFSEHREKPWQVIQVDFPKSYPNWKYLPACLDEAHENVLIYCCKDMIYKLSLKDYKFTEKSINIQKDTQYPRLSWAQIMNIKDKIYLITSYPMQDGYKDEYMMEHGLDDRVPTLLSVSETDDHYAVHIVKQDYEFGEYDKALFSARYNNIYFFGQTNMIMDIKTKKIEILQWE